MKNRPPKVECHSQKVKCRPAKVACRPLGPIVPPLQLCPPQTFFLGARLAKNSILLYLIIAELSMLFIQIVNRSDYKSLKLTVAENGPHVRNGKRRHVRTFTGPFPHLGNGHAFAPSLTHASPTTRLTGIPITYHRGPIQDFCRTEVILNLSKNFIVWLSLIFTGSAV